MMLIRRARAWMSIRMRMQMRRAMRAAAAAGVVFSLVIFVENPPLRRWCCPIIAARSIVTVVLFKIQLETNSVFMLEITIGRVYTLCMLSNLNNRVWITNESSGAVDVTSAVFNRNFTTATESNKTTSAIVRIQKDIEYSTDDGNGQGIPMDPLVYGKRKPGDMEHRNIGYVVSGKKGGDYGGF
ncbi:hypothetical protein FB451DRAFT_1550605 [Mycena latifolia]|nr:hypothetical protein FB451DRAFT_1550605 [Mycena latifolia]